MLREPFEEAVSRCGPHCIVYDMMFPWVTSCGARFGIPVIVSHVTCFFTLCASQCMRLYRPYDVVSTDSEAFVIPGLPGQIEMTRTQVGDYVMMKEDPESMRFFEASVESNFSESYGVIVDSFYELEHDYVDYFRYVCTTSNSLVIFMLVTAHKTFTICLHALTCHLLEYFIIRWNRGTD